MSIGLYDQIMTEVLIAIGGNLPKGESDLASTLSAALNMLNDVAGVRITRQSRWYQTPAWPPGPGSGPDFLNGAAVLETCLGPQEILLHLHEVEASLGRTRRERWEARVCDLDLLACGDAVLPDMDTVKYWMETGGTPGTAAPDQLILPHPRLHERAFVLVPTCDVAPGWVHPVLQRSAEALLADLPAAARDEARPV
jgi:2-amino-4-hydroxy-6-hydroxymethyldihydropteridine diphosphokinase